jgi:hypothetical protein
MQPFCEVENTDPAQHQKWLNKHGFVPDGDGNFSLEGFKGKDAATPSELLASIATNVKDGWYEDLYAMPYDPRTFVMVCGGPSLADHLDEIRRKSLDPNYFVVCSNMTGGYLLSHGITPQAHFILDPKEKKKFDVQPGKVSKDVQYWINVGCHPAVFKTLKEQDIKPYAFLADFSSDGAAIQAVRDNVPPGHTGMMAIQGGTMAGLRAMNLADALGFRRMEYYGFDATVRISDTPEGRRVQNYAYAKKRGEAVIEVTCDKCSQKFDTTLIFQNQVNEFLHWRQLMPWVDVEIIGGGLIDHSFSHLKEYERERDARYVKHRFTPGYAVLQKELHKGDYGFSGVLYRPTIFHGVSQLAKRYGPVSVLDYGSAGGKTMQSVRESFWLPPSVTDFCYDPFVEGFNAEPEPADFVICTDVMEHVEPECTMAVLDHIQALTKKVVFFTISLRAAHKTLSDGRNAHINLRPVEFWVKELKKRFIVSEVSVKGDILMVVAQSIEACREILAQRGQS